MCFLHILPNIAPTVTDKPSNKIPILFPPATLYHTQQKMGNMKILSSVFTKSDMDIFYIIIIIIKRRYDESHSAF